MTRDDFKLIFAKVYHFPADTPPELLQLALELESKMAVLDTGQDDHDAMQALEQAGDKFARLGRSN